MLPVFITANSKITHLKNKKALVLLFAANTVSGVSQGISLIAIPWFIANQLGRPGLYGLLFLAVTILTLFWGPYAGILIDRYDRKKVMLSIQTVGMLSVFSIAALGWYWQNTTLWMAAAIMIITKLIYNIHYPNLYAFAQEITEKSKYGTISSAIEVQGQTTFILSGAIAAFLMEGQFLSFSFEAWPMHEIFMLDAATYILGFVLLSSIRYESLIVRNTNSDAGFATRLQEGFTYLQSKPLILLFGAVAGFVFATILVCSFYTMPIFIDKFLNGTKSVYGFTEASFALGSMLSGFLILFIFPKNKLTLGIISLSLIAAVMYFFIGFNTEFIYLYIAYAFIGFANSGIRVMRTTYIFSVIDNNLIGRTGSAFTVINALIRIVFIGLFSLPFFATAENISLTMFILGLFVILGALILSFNYKALSVLNPNHEQ
ncbi:MAG: DHA3 family macrolide efflux protein-like MFS transporter [Chitinophagales bacterium]